MPSNVDEASSIPRASLPASDLIEKARAFGRLITALTLEDKVFANGVLPERSIEERAAVVEGIVSEKLNAGAWDDAIILVYDPKSLARLLYNGDRKTFDQQALAVAQRLQPKQLRDIHYPIRALDLLANQGKYDTVLQFLETLPLDYELTLRVNIGETNLSKTQVSRLHALYARRAHQEHRYSEAISHYRQLGNTGALDALFDEVLAANVVKDHFNTLLELASSDDTKKKSRLLSIFDNEMSKFISGEESDYSKIKKLYKLYREEGLQISETKKSHLYDAMARHTSCWDIESIKDDSHLKLLWAQKHVLDAPAIAYALFAGMSYQGPELLDVLVAGLQHPEYDAHEKRLHISCENARTEHLTTLLRRKTTPLDVRTKIAKHLGDKLSLRVFSRYYTAKDQNKEAYLCFMHGDGDATSAHAAALRAPLIAQELRSDYPSFHFLKDTDSPGHYEMYCALVNAGHISRAYGLGQHIEKYFHNSAPLNNVREHILENNTPIIAYRFFVDKKDEVGAHRARDALAAQYKVTPEEVTALITEYK
jgi:hypothetical protein